MDFASFSKGESDMSILQKKVRRFINRIIYGHKVNSAAYVKYLRGLGMQIGEGTKFVHPISTVIDETRPWMIRIGEGCCITAGLCTDLWPKSACRGATGTLLVV